MTIGVINLLRENLGFTYQLLYTPNGYEPENKHQRYADRAE